RTNPAIMLNIAYDFHRDWPVIPTIGAGVGAAFTTADDLGDRTKFAYQAIAGLGYQLTDWVTAFADYRFFGTPEIDGRAANRTLSFNNFNHSVVVGLRFKLFDPLTDRGLATDEPTGLRPIAGPVVEKEVRAAKEAAESPIATMPTSYLVFFEVNDTALSGEADATVLTAAESLRRGQHSKAVLTGHTDSAGSAAYNERLARQRAQSVKNRLIELGVSPEQIELRVQGEAEPLVPASGNRPEPRNRRVEINLI
ncbi:MAG TPA: OmpA family protein, partial [Alphaproteobacteria bacterium]|nr:OmpA family protein [Alphaproteobacteria bacterium]